MKTTIKNQWRDIVYSVTSAGVISLGISETQVGLI